MYAEHKVTEPITGGVEHYYCIVWSHGVYRTSVYAMWLQHTVSSQGICSVVLYTVSLLGVWMDAAVCAVHVFSF